MSGSRIYPKLQGVPETMLWSLYERVCEARRSPGLIYDPEALRVYDAIDYDFERMFGRSSGLAAARAAGIDRIVRRWLRRRPSATVVSLGEGLETQAYRVDNGTMRWLSVDLREAIQVREQFIKPTYRFHHLAMSALDERWMDAVDSRDGVFIVAQGLFMYFEPEDTRRLLFAISRCFPGAEMVFDLIPRSTSQATRERWSVTPAYTPPVMPWGLDRNEIKATLRSWIPDLKHIKCERYGLPTGKPRFLDAILDATLLHRQKRPSLVRLAF